VFRLASNLVSLGFFSNSVRHSKLPFILVQPFNNFKNNWI
jgi:hypothetical protein